MKKEVEFDKKMSEKMANSYGGKSDYAMDKALMCWGNNDKVLLQATVIHAWATEIAREREMDARAVRLAEQEMIKKEHDQKMEYVLMKMEGDNKAFIQQYGFNAWRDYVQDKKHLGEGSELERQVEMYREMHRSDVRKLMYKLVAADDNTAKHVALMCWHEFTGAEKAVKAHEEKMANSYGGKHDVVMEKAMMKWGADNNKVLLATVVFSWSSYISQLKETAKRAQEIAEKERLKEIHDNRMKYALLKMEAGNADFNKHFFFNAWCDVVDEENKLKDLSHMDEASAQALCLKELRSA